MHCIIDVDLGDETIKNTWGCFMSRGSIYRLGQIAKRKKHIFAKLFSPALVLALSLTAVFQVATAFGSESITVTTDKQDYAPTELVTVTGDNFDPEKTYTLQIVSSDYPPVDYNADVTTNSAGHFVHQYQLDGIYRPNYSVYVKDGSDVVASTTFTDAFKAAADLYSQCTNDDGDGYSSGDVGCRWTNGAINASNSVYHENDATVQRLAVKDLIDGDHTVIIKYGTTKGGKHAYDFLTNDNFSELSPNPLTNADLCDPTITNLANCATLTPVDSGLIPTDPNAAGKDILRSTRHFRIRNGTWVGTGFVGTPTIVTGTYAGDSDTALTIQFHVNTATCENVYMKQSTPVCEVLITWGAHVSTQADYGAGNSAVNISGSPYHVQIADIDGTATQGGGMDNQMAASAIPPTLTVNKVCVPSNDPGKFNLRIDNNTAGTGANVSCGGTTGPVALAAGSHTVSETAGTGTNLSSYSSVISGDCAPDGTVSLVAGDNKTCTITNTLQTGTLIVKKHVINDNGGALAASAFTLHVKGGGNDVTNSPAAGSESGTSYLLIAGAYVLSENTPPSGYTQTGISGDCDANGNVTVAAGQTKTCTITNDDQQAYIVVDKTVVNNNGGSAVANDFHLTVDGNAVSDEVAYAVNPGTHTAGETNLPGYIASAWGGDCNTSASVTVALGQTKTCTITNDDQQAYVTVTKVVINNNGGSAQPNDFSLKLGANPVSSGVQVPVNPGTYTASETQLAGYTFEGFSGDCNQNGAVTVALGQSKTCTLTNNDQQAYITVVKVVTNDNGGTAQPNDFALTLGGSPVSSGATTPVNPGTYTAGETTVTGYAFEGFSGDCNQNGATTVALGESKTCTLTNNDIQPKLTLVKHVSNNDGGTLGVSDFPLFVSGNSVTSGAKNGFNAGNYTASETNKPGYTASVWSNDCAANGSITLHVGDDKTCEITNSDIAPTLKLVKTVTTDNGGTAVADDWTLHAAAADPNDGRNFTNAGGSGVFETVFAGAEYTLTETNGPSGYTAGAWDCTGGTLVGNKLTLTLDEDVTCTINNDDQVAHLIVIKHVINDNGGTAVAADFTLDSGGASDTPDNFAGVESPGVDVTLDAGSYNVTESGPAGYAASYSANCSGSIANGQTKTCTVTNNDIAPSLKLVKTVTNDNGGAKTPHDWTLTATGEEGFNAFGDDDNFHPVKAGVGYALSESDIPGYTAGAWNCDSGDQNGSTITLALDQDVTCTINNDDQQAYITVVKVVTNDNGGTAAPDDFALTLEGTATTSGTPVPVNPGTYTAGETLLAGYAFSGFSGDCNGDGDVTVALGQSKTCTLTNNDIQPKLKLVKHVTNNNGGTAVVSDFPLFVNATGVTSGVKNGFNAGNYTASETNKTGYAASAWSGDCAADGSITLHIGDDKTCEITNDDIAPKLTLVKTVLNDNGGNAIVSDFPLFVNGNSVTSGNANTLSANTLYTATETNLPGYTAGNWGGACAANGTITLQPGDDKTCTITNDDVAPTLTLVKVVIKNNGGTAGVNDFGLTIGGAATTSGTAKTVTSNTPIALNELGLAGYSFVSLTGDAKCPAVLGGTVTLDEGENVTCTITNDDIAPRLTVIKHVINDNGGTAVAGNFTMTVLATEPSQNLFAGDEAGTTITLDAGSYTVGEIGVTGYTGSFSTDCAGSIAIGQTKTCTVTNDDNAPVLHLRKVVINNNGGTAPATAWTLNADGTATNDLTGSTPVDSGAGLLADTFALSETGGPTGYSASAWICVGGQQNGASITLGIGQQATCTITNDDIAPRLTVIKHVINNDGDIAVASDFIMHLTGTNLSNNDFNGSEAGVTVTLDAGLYSADEQNSNGYIKTLGANCSGTIAVGETKVCTITNNDTPHATRTQGFWQTHTTYTTGVFTSLGGSLTIGNHIINSPEKLFSGFYADISKTSTGAKRTQLDQARMQMLQQWLAAKLNCKAFGCSLATQNMLTAAAAAWAGTDRNLILSYASQLDAYNNSNDALPISGQGKATPKDSQALAAIANLLGFWNNLP